MDFQSDNLGHASGNKSTFRGNIPGTDIAT